MTLLLPNFLTCDEVLEIHQNQISNYGGSKGIRNQDLLQSALAQPEATYGGKFLHETIFDMAAAYCFHLIQNHPFIDGNKRVGLVSALVFLELNGFEVSVDEQKMEEFVLDIASGNKTKTQIADFLETNSHSI